MILLDTNVVSEFMKTSLDTRVINWLNARAKIDFHLCTPVVAEIRHGIAQLPDEKSAKTICSSPANAWKPKHSRDAHCHSITRRAWLRGTARDAAQTGKPMSVMDAMIAAIALAHAMTLATRNVGDFEGLGVPLVDPFSQ